MERLRGLAELISKRNAIAREITAITGRPAQLGHLGEFVAARVFSIDLEPSASNRAFDGRFQKGVLAGQTVNIKWYATKQNLLDMRADAIPDHYLVLTGPPSPAMSSLGKVRPWSIEAVFLFDAKQLVEALKARGRQIGIATSVPKMFWQQAEVFPTGGSDALVLDADQKAMLGLFSATALSV